MLQAEARLAARQQARYEARNIRMRELEKKAKDEEEGGGGAPANSTNHTTSHSGWYFRTGVPTQGCGSGPFLVGSGSPDPIGTYFGNVMLNKQGKNNLKIEVYTFHVNFSIF